MISTDSLTAPFIRSVSALFQLDDHAGFSLTSLSGCANRLWRLDLPVGRFVIKEFRYTVDDAQWVATIRRGAEFEWAAWTAGTVPMAEPVRSSSGELVVPLTGSRGQPTLMRVHRWCDGTPVTWPLDAATVEYAGRQLTHIQRQGAQFSRPAARSLRWWRWQPLDVLEGLRRRALVDDATARSAADLLACTERLVADGERAAGAWAFCHSDHKPDNALRSGDELIVLDWDEAAPCQPRLEAVESALRWAGIERGGASDELFVAFIAGYRAAGGDLPGLAPSDFAKCACELLGWFDYQGRRALREFDDNDVEAASAAETARDALTSLAYVLDRIGVWCALAQS